MSLDKHGQLSAAVIAFYVPVAILTLILLIRHGIREGGWIFLFSFSIVRILGGGLLIAAESIHPAQIGLFVSAFIFEGVGLAPLLLATLGFLKLIGKKLFSDTSQAGHMFRGLHLLAMAAVALSIIGGNDASSSNLNSQQKGVTLRHVGTVLYVVLYVLVVLVHLWAWSYSRQVQKHKRSLLIAISSALPFLAVRVLFSVLNAFSNNIVFSGTAASTPSTHTTNSLSKFNLVSGDWRIYLVMSLLMEYITVLIYSLTGTLVPHSKGDDQVDEEIRK